MTGIRIVFPYQVASAACPSHPSTLAYPSVLTYLATSFLATYPVVASFLAAYLAAYPAFTTAFASAVQACPMVAWSIAAFVVKLLPSVC